MFDNLAFRNGRWAVASLVLSCLIGCSDAQHKFDFDLWSSSNGAVNPAQRTQDFGASSGGADNRVRSRVPDLPQRPITVDLDGLTVGEAARLVFVSELGLSLVKVGKLSAPLEWTSKSTEPAQVKAALESAIRGAGYSISYHGDLVVISETGVNNTDTSAVVPVYHVPSKVISDAVGTVVDGVSVASSGRTVLLGGSYDAVRRAVELVTELDVDVVSASPWKIVTLPRSVALKAADLVEGLSLGDDQSPVTVEPIGNSGVVMVSGVSPQGVEAAAEMLQAVAGARRGQVVRTVTVSDAEKAATAATSLFGDILEDERAVLAVGNGFVSVRGDDHAVSQIVRYLSGLSRGGDWLKISALVAEVQSGSSVDTALSVAASSNGNKIGVGYGAVATGGAQIEASIGSFDIAASWLSSNSHSVVVARPSVSVRSGADASLNVGQSVPILSSVIDTDSGRTTQNVTYEQTGVTLEVAPSVLPDGRIAVDVTQEFSTAAPNGTSNVDSPLFNTRSLRTGVVVGDGEYVVLAGMDTRTQSRRSGLLGPLFRSRSSGSTKTFVLLKAQRQGATRRAVSVNRVVELLKGAMNAG